MPAAFGVNRAIGAEERRGGIRREPVEHLGPTGGVLCRPFRTGRRRRRRIIERPQQPGDVAQRAGFGAALIERFGRLALEIDDEGVPRRHQHLPEMEVAVGAGLQRADRRLGQPVDRLIQRDALTVERSRRGLGLVVGPVPDAVERGKGGV